MQEQVYEQLTLFQEDFPASRFPWLESKRGKRTTATYGRKCTELSESLRRVGSSVRTYLESCGFPLVFIRAGAVPVWASEIEEFPIAVTKKHFPEEEEHET